jgi:hypothetical protein
MLTAQKSLRQKNSEKNCILGEVFSLQVLLQDFLPTMMLFSLLQKKYQKFKCPGHMRPGPWKSCHNGSRNRACHVTAPLVLTWHMQLFVTVSCERRGRGRGPLTWQPLAQNLNVFLIYQKSKLIRRTNCQHGRQHKKY